MTDQQLLTAKAIAARLSFSERQVQDMAAKGEIPAIRVGGRWRFETTAIEQWLAANRTGPQETDRS